MAQATALEKLAITRVVNNWLAVGVLEAKAGGWRAESRERGRVERCLSQAERRLTQAVKAHAFLRGVTAGELIQRIPVSVVTLPQTRTTGGTLPSEGRGESSADPLMK